MQSVESEPIAKANESEIFLRDEAGNGRLALHFRVVVLPRLVLPRIAAVVVFAMAVTVWLAVSVAVWIVERVAGRGAHGLRANPRFQSVAGGIVVLPVLLATAIGSALWELGASS